MVNFLTPEDYFFGTRHFERGASQGGVYNRHIVSVRVEEYVLLFLLYFVCVFIIIYYKYS